MIGVGGMGSAAVYHLARRGAAVLGIERFGIPNDLGSSHGLSRIIRLAYWEHPVYVPLVRRAYGLWRELEDVAREHLLIVTGSIDAGPASSRHVSGAREACRAFGLRHEELVSAELTARFPGYRLPADAVAIFQPEGGYLVPERCIVAHVEAARRLGAEVHRGEQVLGWDALSDRVRVRTTHATYEAAVLLVTAGAWTGSLVPALVPERQVMLWTEPRRPEFFQPGTFPVFYVDLPEGAFYGFPGPGIAGFKIGKYHHLRQATDPDRMDRTCSEADERVLREAIRRYFPDADGPVVAMKPCLFTNTADEHFVIDVLQRHPRVVVAAGFSGHGFKFCSVVGEILAALALDGASTHDISLFALDRLRVPPAQPA